MTPVLQVEGLTVRFRGRGGPVAAVTAADLDVAAGEAVGLVGGSGAGKSTLAHTVVGLLRPQRGAIRLDGVDVASLPRRRARRRRRMAHLVFQDPYASLPPHRRLADIVAEPLVIHRIGDPDERADRVREALAEVGLPAGHLDRYPHQLSGGERQRAAFARALVTRPRLLLADEPTQMLDATLRRGLVELMARLAAERELAVLHITHDLGLARHGCSRLVVMCGGRVVERGDTAQVLDAPAHPYTAALVAAATGRRPR